MTIDAQSLERDIISLLPWLRALAMQLCGRPDEAADLVQEAVERGLRGARAQPPANLRAWLGRVLWNRFIDRWRRQVREGSEPLYDVDRIPATDDQPEPKPRWTTIGDDELRAAVAALESPFRAVYQLHAQGHDYRTISRRLGLPPPPVGTRLFRARKKLRAALESGQRRAADSA